MRPSTLLGVILVALATAASAEEPSAPASPPRAVAAVGALYTCKIHPQIHWSQPADCPLCGMQLVPFSGGKGRSSHAIESDAEAMDMAGHDHAGMNHSGTHCGMGRCGMEMMDVGGMNHGAASAARKAAPTRYCAGGAGGCYGC